MCWVLSPIRDTWAKLVSMSQPFSTHLIIISSPPNDKANEINIINDYRNIDSHVNVNVYIKRSHSHLG